MTTLNEKEIQEWQEKNSFYCEKLKLKLSKSACEKFQNLPESTDEVSIANRSRSNMVYSIICCPDQCVRCEKRKDKLKWIRKCQSCGHKQGDTLPPKSKRLLEKWDEHLCEKCGSKLTHGHSTRKKLKGETSD